MTITIYGKDKSIYKLCVAVISVHTLLLLSQISKDGNLSKKGFEVKENIYAKGKLNFNFGE